MKPQMPMKPGMPPSGKMPMQVNHRTPAGKFVSKPITAPHKGH